MVSGGRFSRTVEGIRRGPSQNPFAFIFSFIAGIFKWILLGLLVIIIVLPVTIYRAGLGDAWAQEIKANIEKAPLIGPVVRSAGEYIPAFWNPEKLVETKEEFTWKASVDKNVGNEELGLRFEDFKPEWSGNFRYKGDKYTSEIFTISTGNINSLMEDSEMSFECDADDGEIKGEVTSPYEPVEIKKDITKHFMVQCRYNGEDFEMSNKILTTYRLRLKADYSFSTLGYLTLYTISNIILEPKLDNNNRESVFEGIENTYLDKKTGIVEPTYTAGPVKLRLRGLFDQPLTEDGPLGNGDVYKLEIGLKRDIFWDGTLKEIKNIYLYMENDIELEENNEFEYVGEEGAFKKYRLANEKLRDLNEMCLNEYNVFDPECWTGSNLAVYADFRVSINNDKLNQRHIWADVQYVYEAQIEDTITFQRMEDLIT